MFTSTKVLTPEQLRRSVPSAFAVEAHESMSDRYGFISTEQVINALVNEGFLPVYARQTNVRDKGKQDYTKHLIRFRHVDVKPVVGDVFPEIVLVNSHDGLSKYKMDAGLLRLACYNGMVVGEGTISQVAIRHNKNVVDGVLEAAFEITEQVPLIAGAVEEMRRVMLNYEERLVLAKAALVFRYEKEPEDLEEIPVKPGQLLQVRRYQDKEVQNTLWGTYNIVQENLTKGGVHYNRVNPETHRVRHQTTREIKSISEDIKLNKALWTLAEEMKNIKG